MSNLALALDHIQKAVVCLGCELATRVQSLGIEAIPTVNVADQINALSEVVRAMGSFPPIT